MEATLTVPPVRLVAVRPDLYDILIRLADRRGTNAETVANEILMKMLVNEEGMEKTSQDNRSLQEILAPFQAAFDATGMTDVELGEFLDREIADHRREKAEAGD